MSKRIRKARRQHLAMTQLELANELGIEPVNVSRWERGVADPKLRYIRRIAELAELPVSWFFEDTPDEPAAKQKIAKTTQRKKAA